MVRIEVAKLFVRSECAAAIPVSKAFASLHFACLFCHVFTSSLTQNAVLLLASSGAGIARSCT